MDLLNIAPWDLAALLSIVRRWRPSDAHHLLVLSWRCLPSSVMREEEDGGQCLWLPSKF